MIKEDEFINFINEKIIGRKNFSPDEVNALIKCIINIKHILIEQVTIDKKTAGIFFDVFFYIQLITTLCEGFTHDIHDMYPSLMTAKETYPSVDCGNIKYNELNEYLQYNISVPLHISKSMFDDYIYVRNFLKVFSPVTEILSKNWGVYDSFLAENFTLYFPVIDMHRKTHVYDINKITRKINVICNNIECRDKDNKIYSLKIVKTLDFLLNLCSELSIGSFTQKNLNAVLESAKKAKSVLFDAKGHEHEQNYIATLENVTVHIISGECFYELSFNIDNCMLSESFIINGDLLIDTRKKLNNTDTINLKNYFEECHIKSWQQIYKGKENAYSWDILSEYTDGNVYYSQGQNAFPQKQNWNDFIMLLEKYSSCNDSLRAYIKRFYQCE